MTGAFGMAGYHFGRKPTSSSSEAPVSMAEGTMPWQTTAKGDGADEHFKYQYHPGGDRNKTPKDAPSALHSVIVPNVTLPKVGTRASKPSRELEDVREEHTNQVNRNCTISSTSMARMDTRGVEHSKLRKAWVLTGCI